MTSLQKLLNRKTHIVLGLNTGTSIDGLDLSIVKIHDRKHWLRVTPLMHRTVKFPEKLRHDLLATASGKVVSLDHLALLDEALGEYIGRSARRFIKHSEKHNIKVDYVSSHGQTVRHHPNITKIANTKMRATLQIGAPEQIAMATNRLVVSHFRQADIAVGGEGAPITTGAVSQCLRHSTESRLIVNIGGIANFFYLPHRTVISVTRAEDIGPGNLLLDQATQALFGKPFDKAGALAQFGSIHKKLLQALLKVTFFEQSNTTRSTGREQYGSVAVKKLISLSRRLGVDKHSILTTLTEFTALRIYLRLQPLLSADNRLCGIYIAGGGAKNSFLIKRLRALFSAEENNWSVDSLSKLEFNPDSFEATCFAILGWMCLKGIPVQSTATRTNKKNAESQLTPILGRITQAPLRSK